MIKLSRWVETSISEGRYSLCQSSRVEECGIFERMKGTHNGKTGKKQEMMLELSEARLCCGLWIVMLGF